MVYLPKMLLRILGKWSAPLQQCSIVIGSSRSNYRYQKMFRWHHPKNNRSQRVENWAVSFENMLEDPIGLRTFTEFLKREFSAENITFWISCKKYNQLTDKLQMKKMAKDIYDQHLRSGAAEAININSHSRQFVLNNLHNPPPHLFAQAEKEIFTLMKFDCYQRFLKSELFSECSSAEKVGKPLPTNFLVVSKDSGRARLRSKSRDRTPHAKKANSTNYSIPADNSLSPPEECSDKRSSLSCAKDIDALWNRLQQRLDDQRGMGMNCEIPAFLLN